MLRSVKFGLYGAVLSGVVGATAAWHGVDKQVAVVVDAQASSVHTTASQVSDILDAAGYHIGPHDLVAPAPNATVHDGDRIVLRRGRLLRLDVNGTRRDIWTTAPTVAAALAELGYPSAAYTSVSRDKRLPLAPTELTVRTPQLVSVVHDGTTQQVTTTDATVGQLLADLDVTVGPGDRLSAPAGSELSADEAIVLTRAPAPAPAPAPRPVVHPAAAPAHPSPAPSPADAGSIPPAATPSAAQAQAIGRRLAAARGWGDTQFSCLVQMWDRESGWRVDATNPGSGAYGIPQALPGDKMASAGPNWRTDAATQITWGLDYIAADYGTPCGAWSTWQAHGGWY